MQSKEVIVVLDQNKFVTAELSGKDSKGNFILDGTPINPNTINVLINLKYSPGRQRIMDLESAQDGGNKPTLLLKVFYQTHGSSNLPWK